MTKIKAKLTKIISSILGFFGIMTFTSCYGAPPMVAMYGMGPNYSAVNGYVTGDTDGDGEKEGVPGIKVVLKSNAGASNSNASSDTPPIINETYTDDAGNYWLEAHSLLKGDYTVEFIDEDGAENGSFETYSETVTFAGEEFEEKEVSLELKPKAKSENSPSNLLENNP